MSADGGNGANGADNKWIGKRTPRPDGIDKVTGRAAFAADFSLPGMLWGRVLRSPHPHARIRSINSDKALALPGVKAVMIGEDLVEFPWDKAAPLGIQDLRFNSRNVMAREKALYVGHPVAAVAAISNRIAADALKLIEVDYEALPWVIDVDEALQPGAPILHEHMRGVGAKPGPGTTSNIAGTLEHKLGDCDAGFAAADVIVERHFKTKPVHQGYIEPHACVVDVKGGQVTIWSSSQGHFMVRDMTAQLTGAKLSDVRAIPAEIGGGFGGKTIVYLEPLALILARKSGRPVKMVMSRQEVFRATGPTSGSSMTVKVGATKDGKITALKSTMRLQAGAFPGSPIRGAVGCSVAPYDLANVHMIGLDIVTNRPKVAAYRAPGAPIGAFAVESTLDDLALALKMDPLVLRQKNAAKQGTKSAYGPTFPRIGYVETLEAALSHPHYKAPLKANQGRGVASGFWFNAGGESSAQVNVNEDGTVVVMTGHPDIGGSRASMMNIAAELLGIDYRRVQALIGDTSSIPFAALTGGSRVTFAAALVVTKATEQVIQTLRERAAKIWKIDVEAVIWENGHARPASTNAGDFQPLSLAELAAKSSATGGPIGGRSSLNTEGAGPGFGTHICDVEVDPETGKVQVLRYTAIQDVGRAIHPSYVEGQLQGGVAQGIGWALNEEFIYDAKGQLDNPTFLDYRMPVTSDLPMIEPVLVEVPNDKHPQGIRGVGEVPLVPAMAAVANAIRQATGLRMTDLPMSPPKVLAALDAAK
ncbi:MAG: xanthine dehydrogenase family protein molybdopterin-binding subunit [Hyphomicrobiaceae bacterium]